VGIAAMKAGARAVRSVDIDPLACAATELAATANDVAVTVACTDETGKELAEDVILAGDVWYEAMPAQRFASWLSELAAKRAIAVFTGDPGRNYVPSTLHELARYDVPTNEELEGSTSKSTRILVFSAAPLA
jgi:predicted nicotinamide N-methyase